MTTLQKSQKSVKSDKKGASFKVEEIKSNKKKSVVVASEEEEYSEEEYSEGEEEYEEGSEGEYSEDEQEYSEEEEDAEDHDETAATENASEDAPKKQKKSKMESRQDAKKLKLERQAARPHNDLVQEAKKLWANVRRRDLKADQRAGPLAELYALLTGKFKELIVKHEASRIIQTCIKYGNADQRVLIANELRGAYPTIAKSRYGKHIINRLLQYCPTVRKAITAEFRGQVAKLIKSVDAAVVLEEIYTEYSNAKEKNALLLEFYGPEYYLFSKNTELTTVPTLGEVLAEKPERRERALKYVREALDAMVNKSNLGHTLIHRLMLEYVTYEEPAKVQDWISTFDEKLVEVLHTFEGSRVVSRCLALATAKQRKTIVKSFKQFIPKIAKEEYGHQVLLAAFATVDDTVLMRGSIVGELLKDLSGYLADRYAQRVIMFLLSGPTSANFILPVQSAQLVKACEAAAAAAGTSKKDSPIRAAELRADLLQPFKEFVEPLIEDDVFANANKATMLMEACLWIPEITTALFEQYFAHPRSYESADFRSFAKKFSRRCSIEQAEALIAVIEPSYREIVESEGAYILMALRMAKPQIQIKQFPTENEHALKLFASLSN